MFSKNVKLATLSAYAQMGVGMLCSLVLVRIATKNLTTEEFGLWSFVFGSIGYFLLLDFGMSYSLGRIFADSIYSNNNKNLSGKISLIVIILGVQGGVICISGIALMGPILQYFHITPALKIEAEKLWIWCIIVQSSTFPLRIFPGIIHALNRVYLANLLSVIAQLVNLLVFCWFILHGAGVMAYAYSSAVSTFLMYLGYILCIFPGHNPLGLKVEPPVFSEMRSIMNYAFSVFASSFAAQASGAAQIMIITRFLGLDAVALYSVTSRVPTLLSTVSMKPFEAHRPQWIAQFCTGDVGGFKSDYAKALRLTMFLLGISFLVSLYFNPIFVKCWTRSEFFAGNLFNVLAALAGALSLLGSQMNITFQMSKRMKFYTAAAIIGAVGEVLLSVILIRRVGLIGVPLAALCCSGGLIMVFNYKYGLASLGIQGLGMFKSIAGLAAVLATGLLVWTGAGTVIGHGTLGYACAGFTLSLGLLLFVFRRQLSVLIHGNGA